MFIKRFVLILCVFVFYSSIATAEQGNVNFIFADSQTGIKVIPSSLFVSNILTKENIYFSPANLQNGQTQKNIPYGNYFLTVNSGGYSALSTNINISKQEATFIINLDPVVSNIKFNSERIENLRTQASQVYLGYIIDSGTLLPLQGVEINCAEQSKKFFSDNNGYFEFSLNAECGGNKYSELSFKKNGYKINIDKNIENYPGNDIILKIKMEQGSGSVVNDEKNFRRRVDEINSLGTNCNECNSNIEKEINLTDPFAVPQSIKVGRTCTGTSCSTVEVYSIDTYCKYVVPAEVYSCWGSLTGGMNSLQAFAVAVRTYALYYVYHPINSTYDICDNTSCQMFGSTLSTNSNNAVDNTSRYVLLNTSGNIVRSEYAAENNNLGCGDGFCGTGSAWPCISDLVCSGTTSNGHGRGMCQWGTVRWATGTKVLVTSPCSIGVSHGYGTKTWQGILDHYYNVPGYTWALTQGGTSKINSSTSNPNSIPACGSVSVQYNLTTSGNLNLFLAASIAPTGTSNYISDPAHDVKVNISNGTSNYNRSFTVPCNTVPGSYDLFTALWYDKNNNNVIDAGDLVIDSKLTSHALTISPSSGINLISTEIPERYFLHPNYPNPFNPMTNINYDLRFAGLVSLKIYDAVGNEVAALVSERQSAGVYSVSFDATLLPSGIYFYRMVSGSFTDTKKMIVVK